MLPTPPTPRRWTISSTTEPCPNCGKLEDHRADGLFRKGYLCQPPSTPTSRKAARIGALVGDTVPLLTSMEKSLRELGLDTDLITPAREAAYRAQVSCAEAAGDLRCPNCDAVGEPGHHFMDTEEFVGYVCIGRDTDV